MKHAASALSVLAVVLAMGLALSAQASPPAASTATSAGGAYVVTFYLTATPAGKPAETREYVMRLDHNAHGNSIETSTRVPVPMGGQQFSYEHVGTELKCTLLGAPDPPDVLSMLVSIDVSSIVSGSPGSVDRPAFSTAQAQLTTRIRLGQRQQIAAFEDATTHTGYQLAVAAVPAGAR